MSNQMLRALFAGLFGAGVVAGQACSKPPLGGGSGTTQLSSSDGAAAFLAERYHLTASPAGAGSVPVSDVTALVPPMLPAPKSTMAWQMTGTVDAMLSGNPNVASYRVLLGAAGELLVWETVPKDTTNEILPRMPEHGRLAASMAAADVRYLGLPESPPAIGVPELIERADEQGFADLAHAQEVRIKRVVESSPGVGEAPRPVWILNVRGITPRPGKGPAAKLPETERNHLRLVYDERGTLLYADNLLD